MTDLVTGCERVDIADQLIRLAHIASDDLDQGPIGFTALGKLHDRGVEAFFIDGVRIRAEPASADVDNVRGAGEKADQLAQMEGRADHGDVMEMVGSLPGIIGDVDIVLEDVLTADTADKMGDG